LRINTRAIQEPVFSVANTDFEGGDNDNGYGDYIFLVKHGQPSHRSPGFYRAILTLKKNRPVEKADFLINPPRRLGFFLIGKPPLQVL
jgi:hypothetical protein